MLLEEKLRRASGLAGLVVVAISLIRLVAAAFANSPPGIVLGTTALTLLGAALWLRSGLKYGRAGSVCAIAGFALVMAVGVMELAAGSVHLDQLFFRPTSVANASGSEAGMPLDATVVVAAAGVALMSFGRKLRRLQRAISVWLAAAVFAISLATLVMWALSNLTTYARTLQISAADAATLLLVSIGTLLLRPDSKLVRMLLAQSAAGALTRRMFYGVTLL
ncbi:MAG TPA: hypothetical protein VL069_03570, partial [Opitutus sp.]|nr:hypothetical protein [Opitutus sp.]